MSYNRNKRTIEEGDVVVLYMGIHRKIQLRVGDQISKDGRTVSDTVQTVWGCIKPKSLIGMNYGSKIQLSKGWAYVISANPDMWTYVLPHKTQIIYGDDISSILFELDIKPGHIVVEAGTGSGSLTNAIIHTIKDTGHLFTFDFHGQRVADATELFKERNLSSWVTLVHRDVLNNGFGTEFYEKADALFLDLPSPQLVVPHAFLTVKKGGKICFFLPCIEQVQLVLDRIQHYGFINIKIFEIVQHERMVRNRKLTDLQLDLYKDVDEGSKNCSNILIDALKESQDALFPSSNSPLESNNLNNINGSPQSPSTQSLNLSESPRRDESPLSSLSSSQTTQCSLDDSSKISPQKRKSHFDFNDGSTVDNRLTPNTNDVKKLKTVTLKVKPAPGHSGFLIIAEKPILSDDEASSADEIIKAGTDGIEDSD